MTRIAVSRAIAGMVASALVAAAVAWFARGAPSRPPAAPAPATPGPVAVVDGVAIVELAPAVQQRSGIASQAARAAGQDAARRLRTIPGVVMDLQPLVEWRHRLASARAQFAAAQAQAQASDQELRRTKSLFADDQNASRRTLEAAQAAQVRDQARMDAARAAVRALEDQGRQQFGAALLAVDAGRGDAVEALLARRESVVAIPIAVGAAPPALIEVETPSGGTARGSWMGAAAQVDPRLGSGLQLYRVASWLPAGMSATAYVGARSSGTLVPSSAVVWQAGQPWAYVRRDASHFARTALLDALEVREGFVVPRAIRPGDQIVVQGAQLLLSQEQLPPPGGRACKDPECD